MSWDSLRRDVGQLLWIGFEGERADGALARRLRAGEAGAAVLFARNLARDDGGHDLRAIAALAAELRDLAPEGALPPLVCVDQEGGRVQRVREPATRWPPMLGFDRVRADRAEPLAEAVGDALGRELAWLGFDVDFAPVLDVHTNPDNPIIGDRAFSTSPEPAAARALALARGLARAGILGCGKHFPGHGDTRTDSHLELPTVDRDLAGLREVELLPFARAAEAGIPMIMTAHVVFPALAPGVPATLSPGAVTELLRSELGYRGVVVSDDLDMRAIADGWGAGDAAVAAVAAGCDVLLACRSEAIQDASLEALVREAEASPAFRDRIRDAARRVRALKKSHLRGRRGCLREPDWAAHRRLADELAGS